MSAGHVFFRLKEGQTESAGGGGGPSSHPDGGCPFGDQLGRTPSVLNLTTHAHTRTRIPVAYISNGTGFVWVFVFLAWRQKEALAAGLVQTGWLALSGSDAPNTQDYEKDKMVVIHTSGIRYASDKNRRKRMM